jgi:hypothetical protein
VGGGPGRVLPGILRGTTAATWRRAAVRSLLVTAIVLGIAALLTIEGPGLSDLFRDTRAYYGAGARLNAGLPLYQSGLAPDATELYRYPPLLAILFRPLALLPLELATAIWMAVVVASFVGLLVLLGRSYRALAALALVALPVGFCLAVGQAQLPVTLLVALGTPWSIALAANLKVFPAFVALYWIGRREWRRVGELAAWMAGLGLVQLLLAPEATLAYPGFLSLDQVGAAFNFSPYAISPALWALFVVVACTAALLLARRRGGWAIAVVVTTVETPRLLLYLFAMFLAAFIPRRDEQRREPS